MSPKRAELFIVAIIALVVGGRGIAAIWFGSMDSSPTHSAPIHYSGKAATMMGEGWIGLAGLVVGAWLLARAGNRLPGIAVLSGSVAAIIWGFGSLLLAG